jgi:hypothetical protein
VSSSNLCFFPHMRTGTKSSGRADSHAQIRTKKTTLWRPLAQGSVSYFESESERACPLALALELRAAPPRFIGFARRIVEPPCGAARIGRSHWLGYSGWDVGGGV